MEILVILFGLLGATVLAIGWATGNVFICVFMSLGTLFLALVLGPSALLALPVIWAPKWIAAVGY